MKKESSITEKTRSFLQHEVMVNHGTEPPGSSPLNYEKRTGIYYCASCHTALFQSNMKYESHCGWPSFSEAIKGAIETELDTSHHMVRTEIHCAKCKAHLGHLFDDGPQPTGYRYCVNGIALDFKLEKDHN